MINMNVIYIYIYILAIRIYYLNPFVGLLIQQYFPASEEMNYFKYLRLQVAADGGCETDVVHQMNQ